MAKANRYQMHMVPLQTMVDEAIDFIREHEPEDGYELAFSGGKDSVCTEWLLKQSSVQYSAHYCVALDPPELQKFIRNNYPHVVWKYPRKSFYELIQTNDPPMRWQRWCCKLLKKHPGKGTSEHYVLGLRAEESSARRSRPRIDYNGKLKQTEFKPIFSWLEWHVWDLIESYRLPYCNLYDEGFSRLGCVVCPNHSYKQKMLNKKRWPGYFRAFEHAVTRWFNAKRLGRDNDFATAQQYIQAWYRGFH